MVPHGFISQKSYRRWNVCHSAQMMLPSFYNSALYTAVVLTDLIKKADKFYIVSMSTNALCKLGGCGSNARRLLEGLVEAFWLPWPAKEAWWLQCSSSCSTTTAQCWFSQSLNSIYLSFFVLPGKWEMIVRNYFEVLLPFFMYTRIYGHLRWPLRVWEGFGAS